MTPVLFCSIGPNFRWHR